jgi:Sigma-70 region 2
VHSHCLLIPAGRSKVTVWSRQLFSGGHAPCRSPRLSRDAVKMAMLGSSVHGSACGTKRVRVVTFGRARGMKELDEVERLKRSQLRAQLMERLQQGDPDACKALLDDVGPSLTYFLRRRVADPDELEDVYQEVFMAIFQARHTYEPGRPFEPWLFAIARNIAVDYTRRRWSRAHWEELVANPPERPAETSNAAAPEL